MSQNVTVIIAAYNAAATIARAVRSALAEPEVAEIVVIDDASTDDTAARALAVDDKTGRLRILVQAKNFGPSAARNRAILESVSPWIAILDADDFFLPGRMKGLLAFAEENDLVADDLWQVSEGAEDGSRRSLLDGAFAVPCPITLQQFVLSNVTRRGRSRGELGFIKPIIRRSFLQEHGLTYRDDMRLGEDYEIYVRALGSGARLALVPAQGYMSVVRPNSLSGLHSEMDLQRLRDCNIDLMKDLNLSADDKAALRTHYLSMDCRLQWRNLILAIKKRNIKAAIACFMRPFPVPFYVMGQLGTQIYLRSIRRIIKSESGQQRSGKFLS